LETESTIIAIQNQVIATRVIETKVIHKSEPSLSCRLCGQAEETIVHLLSVCPVLAPTAYLHRHNLIAAAVHCMTLDESLLIPGGWPILVLSQAASVT